MNMLPDSDLFTLLAGATLAVKMVLLFLAAMSLWSWTIIFYNFLPSARPARRSWPATRRSPLRRSLVGTQGAGAKEQSPLSRVSTLAVKEFRLLEKADVNRERKRLLVKDTLRRVLKQGISRKCVR